MFKSGLLLLHLLFLLAACAQQATPTAPAAPTASALPAASLPAVISNDAPRPSPSATLELSGDLFLKISHSTDVLRLKCDPLEIIFNVTVKNPDIKHVAFFFRMKDKATGMVTAWSNGDDMRTAGSGIFQFIFQARAIPNEARTKEAWVQFQFAGLNKAGESLGRSQIFASEITYTNDCP